MKKFIYVLVMPVSGTHQLAHALRSIGIDAHHEIIDIRPIYLEWMKKRFTSDPALNIESAEALWKDNLLEYLKGEGYFADISHYISMLYPLIDRITSSMNIDSRSIFITRKMYPHRLRAYGNYSCKQTGMRIDDNTISNNRDLIYTHELSWSSDITWEAYTTMSHFERLCWQWKLHNEYFMKSNRKIFHVEDFNTRSLEILNVLYPEATEDQKRKFKETLFYRPLSPDKSNPPYTLEMTNNEKQIYSEVCEPTLKRLGY